jgi:hypothetical protein
VEWQEDQEERIPQAFLVSIETSKLVIETPGTFADRLLVQRRKPGNFIVKKVALYGLCIIQSWTTPM